MSEMRMEFLQCKQQMSQYKAMYRVEKKESFALKKQINDLNKDKIHLQEKLQWLELRLHNDNDEPACKCTRKRKTWDSIKCDRTRCDHISKYKNMLFDCLKSIEKCHRAEMSIWIDNNRFQYSWSPKDFNTKVSDMQTEDLGNISLLHDHCYCNKDDESSECEVDFDDIDYSEMFDCKGNWKKIHIRKLVHVLDTFRISQEAYHELHMVSKGHLPPLRRLIYEKGVMSEEIPYAKIPNVSQCWKYM